MPELPLAGPVVDAPPAKVATLPAAPLLLTPPAPPELLPPPEPDARPPALSSAEQLTANQQIPIAKAILDFMRPFLGR